MRTWNGPAAGGLALILCALAPASARAQPAPKTPASGAGEEATRSALYREGVDAALAGRWAEARERFAAALAIRASPRVFFSLGQAEEQLGLFATAQRDYERARESARSAGEAEALRVSEAALRAIEARVPHVRILTPGVTDATATLDDAPVEIGAVVAVDPGTHRLRVTAPGMRTSETTVAVGSGAQLDAPIRMERGDAAATAPPPPHLDRTSPGAPASSSPAAGVSRPSQESPPHASALRAAGLATFAAGVVGVAVGTYFGLDAKSKYDQSNATGCSNDLCTPSAAAVRRDALSAATVSTVAFAVGGVLVAGGAALWLFAPSPKAAAQVGVAPIALQSGAALLLSGAWR